MQSHEQVFTELRGLLLDRGILSTQEVSMDTELKQLLIDSVEIALIFSHFEQKYDAMFENQEILGGKYKNLGEIVSTISQKIN